MAMAYVSNMRVAAIDRCATLRPTRVRGYWDVRRLVWVMRGVTPAMANNGQDQT
jgi:hypothetical protein